MIDALLLVGLIVGAMALAWVYDAWADRRRERMLCPICQGLDKQAAFKDGGFRNWCPTHRDTWYESSTVWVR